MLQVLQLGLSGAETTLPTESRSMESTGETEFALSGRSANGTLHTDFISKKKSWTIVYGSVSDSTLDTIKAIYQLQLTNGTFLSFIESNKSGSTTTYSVKMSPITWSTQTYLDDWYYTGVTIVLEQV